MRIPRLLCALLLLAGFAGADVVTTISEVVTGAVAEADAMYIRVKLSSGGVKMIRAADVRAVTFTHPQRLEDFGATMEQAGIAVTYSVEADILPPPPVRVAATPTVPLRVTPDPFMVYQAGSRLRDARALYYASWGTAFAGGLVYGLMLPSERLKPEIKLAVPITTGIAAMVMSFIAVHRIGEAGSLLWQATRADSETSDTEP